MSTAEAPRLDHRDVNRDLRVFATDPLAGAGLPLWLPGGAVIRVDGPAALTPEPDGWLRADLELATHIVAGTYVLEFGLVDPRRPEAFQSVAPSVRVTLTGSWAAGITGKRTRP